MDAETLRARHRAAVARYARQVGDDGSVPDGLLRELREAADEYATARARLALEHARLAGALPQKPARAASARKPGTP